MQWNFFENKDIITYGNIIIYKEDYPFAYIISALPTPPLA